MLQSELAEKVQPKSLKEGRPPALTSSPAPRVLVVGSAHLDILSCYSEQHAHVLDKPGRVVFAVGGSGFNVAADLAWAGPDFGLGRPLLYTHLRAQSWSTSFVLDRIRRAGIETRFVQEDAVMPYESAFVGQFREAQLETAVSSMAIEACHFHPGDFAQAFRQAGAAVADCNLSPEQLQKVVNQAEACRIPLVVNGVSEIKSQRLCGLVRPEVRQSRITVVLTEEEAAATGNAEASPERLCAALRADSVLLTRGEHGWSCLRADGAQQVVYASQGKQIRSGAGAGDAVVAAVTVACALGIELEADVTQDLIHNFTAEVLKRPTASMADSRIPAATPASRVPS